MDKKILIVDDSKFMRIMLKEILKNNNLELAGEAINGADAVDKFKELNPYLVLMDITMPNNDGMDALKKIKKINKDAKVIMCSSISYQNVVLEAINLGASDFIVKPFSSDKVVQAIKKYL